MGTGLPGGVVRFEVSNLSRSGASTSLVDTTALVVVSTLVQTVVISITLIVFILQFRSQERAIKQSAYQGLIGRYNELISTLVDKPDLALSFFVSPGGAGDAPKNATKEDIAVYSHLLLAYGIIEEAYVLRQKNWISETEWNQWSTYLERLAQHPMFPLIHRMSSGTFDKGFEEFASTKIGNQ